MSNDTVMNFDDDSVMDYAMNTFSMCDTCYHTIPAKIQIIDGVVWLHKSCDKHGDTKTLVEASSIFYDTIRLSKKDDSFNNGDTTIVNATDRCNVRCPQCYHMPDKTPDISINDVVDICKLATTKNIILMGGEPTIRKDLPELVKEIKCQTAKTVAIYTNGIELKDNCKVLKLLDAGVETVCFSLHTKNYLKPHFYEDKRRALVNIHESGMHISHIAFSMRTIDDLDEILSVASELWHMALHIRIRIPAMIGECQDMPFFLSDMVMLLGLKCKNLGWSFKLFPGDNNTYHVNVIINDKMFRLIRWPSIKEVNLGELQCPPYALFIPELGEENFIYQALIQDAIKTNKLDRNEISAIRRNNEIRRRS